MRKISWKSCSLFVLGRIHILVPVIVDETMRRIKCGRLSLFVLGPSTFLYQ
jgi:hypothetical protein